MTHWYTSPEWWLCILGLATLIFIAWQAWETRKAAQSARDGIRLQETLNQQWVEISGWRKEGFGSRELTPPRFTIAAEIGNTTQAPLTVQFVFIGVPGKPLAEYEIKSMLAPNAEPIKITYSGEVEPMFAQSYNMGHFPVVIQGQIRFTDCFEKERTQSFRRACYLGPGIRFQSVAISELENPIANPQVNQNPD
jgi:hypothetical protein